MTPNRFPGRCHECGCWVPADAGFLVGRDIATDHWLVACPNCVEGDDSELRDRSGRWTGDPGGHSSKRRVDRGHPIFEAPASTSSEDARRRAAEFRRQAEEYDRQAAEHRLRERQAAEARERAERLRRERSCHRHLVILGLTPPCDAETIKARFRELAHKIHPDHGGDSERFIELRGAYDEALRLAGNGGSR
jgi:DnaJ domain